MNPLYRLIIATALTAILAFLLGLVMPWWSIAVAGGITGFFIPAGKLQAFMAGFLAVFFLWGLQSYLISVNNHHILAHRLSGLVFRNENPYLILIFTGMVGGFVSGMASLAGYNLSDRS